MAVVLVVDKVAAQVADNAGVHAIVETLEQAKIQHFVHRAKQHIQLRKNL